MTEPGTVRQGCTTRRRARRLVLWCTVLPLLPACSDDSALRALATSSTVPATPATPPPTLATTTTTTLPATTTTELVTTTTEDLTAFSSYATYTVQPDLSVTPTMTAADQVLWDLFRRVLGDPVTLQYVESFTVYIDEYRNVDATVLPGITPGKRQVMVNARYGDDLVALTRTFIHEYGHIITLAGDQVTADANCGTTEVDEGCLTASSYLNGFLNRYWWTYGNEVFDALASPSAMDQFYAAHQTDFVTRYAASNPVEDIAEVWAEFVLRPVPPPGATIAEQKILYLYGFPALVALRDEVRARVADMLPV